MDCNVWNLMRENCNEECEEWMKCSLANILREGKQIAEEKDKLGGDAIAKYLNILFGTMWLGLALYYLATQTGLDWVQSAVVVSIFGFWELRPLIQNLVRGSTEITGEVAV